MALTQNCYSFPPISFPLTQILLQHWSNYFDTEYKIAVNEMTLEDCDHFRKEKLRTMEQAAAYERLKAVIPIHPADSTKYLFMMFLFSGSYVDIDCFQRERSPE